MSTIQKTSILLGFIFIACLAFSECAVSEIDYKYADYLDMLKKQKEKEILDVRNVVNCDFSGVFLVAMFDGYIPIPNSYYFRPGGSNGNFFEFDREKVRGKYFGTILIGSYNSLRKSIEEKGSIQNRETVGLSGLRVIKSEVNFADNPKEVLAYKIILHDENQFLMITDQNEHLWEAMLDGYQALKDAKCAGKD